MGKSIGHARLKTMNTKRTIVVLIIISFLVMLFMLSPETASAADEREESVGEIVGLLWWPADPAQSMYSFSKDMDNCLTRYLLNALPQISLVRHEKIQDLLYPWMEPGTQPENEQDFAALMRREDVHLRLAGVGVRFLVAFSGSTRTEDWKGGIFCGGGYGGAGCLGYSWAGKKTALDAVLWDLADIDHPELAEASKSGTSIMPALLLPIPIPASTQSGACRELGRRISMIIQERHVEQDID